MVLALLSSHAYAEGENNIVLRGNVRDESTRIVMAGKTVPKYTVNAQGQKYTVTFSDGAKIDSDLAGLSSLPRVTSYKILSPQSFEIDVASGQKVDYFVVANKVIFDIKGHIAKEEKPQPDLPKAEKLVLNPTITPAVKDNKDQPVLIVDDKKLPKHIVIDHAPVVTTQEAPPAVVAVPVPAPKPVLVNVISTSAIPLVVYMRGGYLWVAEDRENASVPPSVEGMNGLSFSSVPVKGFSLFRMKWPQTVPLYASGGGLVWKLTNDIAAEKKHPAVPIESQFGEASKTGPALLWPAKTIHRVADFMDPDTGEPIKLVFVNEAADHISESHRYAEIDILPSLVGLAFVSKTDDMVATKTAEGLTISRPNGLALSPQKDMMTNKSSQDVKPDEQRSKKIFDFKKWQIGDKKSISDNQRIIMSGLSAQTDVKRAENLIGLGQMMLSFGYAQEAIGYFALAEQLLPDLNLSPEFQASKAVSETLAGRSKEAFLTLSSSQLNNLEEIKYWKAYALAELDDWQQAAATMPSDLSILKTYPLAVLYPIALQMAEISLRQGEPKRAKTILDIVAEDRSAMNISQKANFDYLSGEYARQTGRPEESKELWSKLTAGVDDLFRAKARFALSTLLLEKKEITVDKAIDNLEGLRYAWRGDGLEVSINNNLAKLYLQKGAPLKALTLLRHAASLTPNTEQGKKITAELHTTFNGLFTPEAIKNLTPIDAMTVYNEFSDLVPAGPEGEKISRQLAERLVDADMLPRAASLLQKQVDAGLKGAEGADVALRLASLLVLDGKGDRAGSVLDKAEEFLKGATQIEATPRQHDISVLRAKALSMIGKPQEAFEVLSKLPQDEAVLKMRADIAWRNKKWQDAADALEQVLGQQDISLTRPLSDDQASTILNWAVALYLSDNRYVLANLRERYADAMAQTMYAKKFDVITRPRQMGLLADRDTIQSIVNETDMFKDFLTSFKQDAAKITATAPRPAAEEGGQLSGGGSTTASGPIPDALKNSPLLKTDEFQAD